MELRAFEGGDVSLVYSREFDEGHIMQAARPAICLLGSALNLDGGCDVSEKWGCDA